MEQAKKIASYKVTADSGGRAVFLLQTRLI